MKLFDANQISGWTESKTTAPKLYTSISKTSLYNNNNVVYLTDYFNSIDIRNMEKQLEIVLICWPLNRQSLGK